MSLRRYGNTDEQEEALGTVEEWGERAKFKLRYGTSIGKSPQSVILDHKYQDGIIHVGDEGEITFHSEVIDCYSDFEVTVEKHNEAEEEKAKAKTREVRHGNK